MRLSVRALSSISLAFTPLFAACENGTSPLHRFQPLTVVHTIPAADSLSVGREPLIIAFLSDFIDRSSVTPTTFSLAKPGGALVEGTVSSAGGMVGFVPAQPLDYETTYTATVATDFSDYQGQRLAAPYSWSFSTGTAPPQ